MKVTVEITPQQAVVACKAIAGVARTQNYFRFEEGQGAYGPFAMDWSSSKGWEKVTEEEVCDGQMLALAQGNFGWTTTSGNKAVVYCQSGQWYLSYSGRRHALRDTGNGVGQIFAALGGADWANTAYVKAYETTTSEREWWA